MGAADSSGARPTRHTPNPYICQLDGADDLELEDDDLPSGNPPLDNDDELREDNDSLNSQLSLINVENEVACADHCVNFILTNARSLKPKFDSMMDAFKSLNLDFLCATETWFKGGKDLNEALLDLVGKAGVSVIHKSRDGRQSGRGGGVAFAFNKSACNLERRALGGGCSWL